MEQITYEENILLKAIELAKTRLSNTWAMLPEATQQLEIQWAIPEAKKAMEWAAETAHAVNGPQLSKSVVDSMLVILGVIPSKNEINEQ
jgi:hypothetical protein